MYLLRHFVPGTELDLPTMRTMIASIEKGRLAQPSNAGVLEPQPTPQPRGLPAPELIEADESSILKEEQGCMLVDSLGKYRYVGADSSLRFNHATHAAQSRDNGLHKQDPKVIPPLRSGHLPPPCPENTTSSRPFYRERIYLPARDVCVQYMSLFLQEIQCVYWFFSHEQVYSALDRTFEDAGVTASAQWVCSLYSIFAICSSKTSNSPIIRDVKTPTEYLSMAKSLIPQVCDGADEESVRALALLSLALHSTCYSVSAYSLLGTATRISFSLGMHRNVSPRGRDSVEREKTRRLWWTLYLLDQELAIRLGYPCAIVDEVTYIQTPAASEEILDPGSNMPLGYQSCCVSLVKLKKQISHSLYFIPAQSGGKVSFQEVSNRITMLRDWLIAIPSHLRWDSSVPPSHKRAVFVLHLRYWMTLIHVTRPFLLYAVLHASKLTASPQKQKRYEELSHTCLEASENAFVILKRMMQTKCLSSLLLFDSGCIQELVQTLVLAIYKRSPSACREKLEFCVTAIRSMDQVGWCEKILPEILALVDESGVLIQQQHLQPTSSAQTSHRAASSNHADLNETFFDQFLDFEL
ncbi:hypothetical protein AJ79_02096 [Helicocarpus griseus UAMH5409]|uniref:Xylanolytic transcriptional activator regulatory domain-containing protein n=1 Tax=Helicocarpus griseus UAMH5409 TaxID=1447875 RepID=A0A2B7Y456_9EURO|nr:hypothetical protein AJ79_02096 [Helicocarpus griseus UAMH5409]